MFTLPSIPFLRFKRRSAAVTPAAPVLKSNIIVDGAASKILIPATRPRTAVSRHVMLGHKKYTVLLDCEYKRFTVLEWGWRSYVKRPAPPSVAAVTITSTAVSTTSTAIDAAPMSNAPFASCSSSSSSSLSSDPGLSQCCTTDSNASLASVSSYYSTETAPAPDDKSECSFASSDSFGPAIAITPPDEGDLDMPAREAYNPADCLWRRLDDPDCLAPPARTYGGAMVAADTYFIMPVVYLFDPPEDPQPSLRPFAHNLHILCAPPVTKRGRMFEEDEDYFFSLEARAPADAVDLADAEDSDSASEYADEDSEDYEFDDADDEEFDPDDANDADIEDYDSDDDSDVVADFSFDENDD